MSKVRFRYTAVQTLGLRVYLDFLRMMQEPFAMDLFTSSIWNPHCDKISSPDYRREDELCDVAVYRGNPQRVHQLVSVQFRRDQNYRPFGRLVGWKPSRMMYRVVNRKGQQFWADLTPELDSKLGVFYFHERLRDRELEDFQRQNLPERDRRTKLLIERGFREDRFSPAYADWAKAPERTPWELIPYTDSEMVEARKVAEASEWLYFGRNFSYPKYDSIGVSGTLFAPAAAVFEAARLPILRLREIFGQDSNSPGSSYKSLGHLATGEEDKWIKLASLAGKTIKFNLGHGDGSGYHMATYYPDGRVEYQH